MAAVVPRGSAQRLREADFDSVTGKSGDGGIVTTDAKREATRDGAPPFDLIDGDRLCDLRGGPAEESETDAGDDQPYRRAFHMSGTRRPPPS